MHIAQKKVVIDGYTIMEVDWVKILRLQVDN